MVDYGGQKVDGRTGLRDPLKLAKSISATPRLQLSCPGLTRLTRDRYRDER
jgi:hypothetical protein